jgi:hypothetical protein
LAGARIPYHLERIMQMIDIYGQTEVLSALARACEYGAYHCEYVENIVQQSRGAAAATNPRTPPSLKHGLDIRLRDIDMSQYQIQTEDDDE